MFLPAYACIHSALPFQSLGGLPPRRLSDMDTVRATTIVQEDEHGYKNSIGTKDSMFAQVYIDGEMAPDNDVFVYNSTMLTFTSTPANDDVQKITQEGNITLYMLCSGDDLNLCQNTADTGDKSFAYLPPVVDSVDSTGARKGFHRR